MITYFVCKQRNHLNWFILLGKQWPAATWIGLKFIEIENACFNHCNENVCAFGGALCSVCSRWFVIFIPFKCIFHGHNQFSRVMSKSALFLSFSDAIATMRDFLSHVYTNVGYVWLKAMSMYICYIHALSLKIDGIWCDATRRFSLCNQMPKLQFSVSFWRQHISFSRLVLKQLGILNSERHTNTNMHQMPDSNTYLIWSC